MTSYITAVAATNAISTVPISARFMLPVSGKHCLAFQGSVQIVLSPQLKLVFLALAFLAGFFFNLEMNRDV